MEKIAIRYYLLIIIFAGISRCLGQTPDSVLIKHENATGLEKIYIHYDRNNYSLGDTVWFKAYLFNGRAKSKSKNFYFELFDDKGKLLKRIIAPIFESTASGSLVLPEDDNINGLFCRAYTAAILNENPALAYNRQLPVIDLKRETRSSTNNPVSIRFLPEGGDLITDIPSAVAFKITDLNGFPVAGSGKVMFRDSVVAMFSTVHDGMGVFTMVPKDGQVYRAIWTDRFGTNHNTLLPAQKPKGVVIHIGEATNGKKFFVFRSHQVDEADKTLLLTATQNGRIVYEAKLNLSGSESASGTIPVKDLPSGILKITIFDKSLMPVAERITFVNNYEYNLDADIKAIAINTQKRSINKFKLILKDTTRANFSISVTAADSATSLTRKDNIISYLFLTSDLRGKIINPTYYFGKNSDSLVKHLDLVMLTNGWRKYNWNDGDKSAHTQQLTEHNYLTIEGNISGVKNLSNMAHLEGNIIVQTEDSARTLLPVNINKNGFFYKGGVIFYGDAKLSFKFSDNALLAEYARLTIKNGLIDNLHIPPFKPVDLLTDIENPASFSANPVSNYPAKKGTKLLKEVVIKGSRESQIHRLDDSYTSGLFSRGISTNFIVGEDPKALNNFTIFQYLQNKIPGLEIFNPVSDNPTVRWRAETPVKFFLNNIESNTQDIREIGMGEFDYVKIYDPAMGGAFGAPGGVISIYTKKGKGFNFDVNDKLNTTMSGYTPVKEFYSPDYATTAKTLANDTRTTLYWNPNIILDNKNREFDLQFYNNDITRKFKIEMVGSIRMVN
ncbi:hypothetical protein [Mucilaginibacter sp.]|uniref:hypothetical protein n=1 Tax=Mucilaginibacter sp. TaxID=1882438 RepID=UPI0025F25096|nr:hypothetical protein [Mucilaginibacter sp.]